MTLMWNGVAGRRRVVTGRYGGRRTDVIGEWVGDRTGPEVEVKSCGGCGW